MSYYKVNVRQGLKDYIDEADSCGVWVAGPPPPVGDQSVTDYLHQLREHRDSLRSSQQNPCRGCGLNTDIFDYERRKAIELCDYFLVLYHTIDRWHPRRSAKGEMAELADIHQACDFRFVASRDECRACPLSKEIRVDAGIRPAALSICQSFERMSPRRDLPWRTELDDSAGLIASLQDDKSVHGYEVE